MIQAMPPQVLTASSSPQTQAAPSGAFGILGSSFLVGNLVESGLKGMEVGILSGIRKSLTCWRRSWILYLSDMLTNYYGLLDATTLHAHNWSHIDMHGLDPYAPHVLHCQCSGVGWDDGYVKLGGEKEEVAAHERGRLPRSFGGID